MTQREMDFFEKKSNEREIRKLSVDEIDRIVENMSPIDYNLKYFDEYCEKNNINKEKNKNSILNIYKKNKIYFETDKEEKYMEYIKDETEMENNLYEMYEKADEPENIDINYNDDIEFKNVDY